MVTGCGCSAQNLLLCNSIGVCLPSDAAASAVALHCITCTYFSVASMAWKTHRVARSLRIYLEFSKRLFNMRRCVLHQSTFISCKSAPTPINHSTWAGIGKLCSAAYHLWRTSPECIPANAVDISLYWLGFCPRPVATHYFYDSFIHGIFSALPRSIHRPPKVSNGRRGKVKNGSSRVFLYSLYVCKNSFRLWVKPDKMCRYLPFGIPFTSPLIIIYI